MQYNPDIHHRRSIRLRGYDYRQAGAYFITTCVQNRECLFGKIVNGNFLPNQYAAIVDQFWSHIPKHFPTVEIDSAVVMPNHFHGIVVILDAAEMGEETSPLRELNPPGIWGVKKPALGQVVGYFKYQTTKAINQLRDTQAAKVWQRNYYEHIIRNERSLGKLRDYIMQNPQRWDLDQLHPSNPSKW